MVFGRAHGATPAHRRRTSPRRPPPHRYRRPVRCDPRGPFRAATSSPHTPQRRSAPHRAGDRRVAGESRSEDGRSAAPEIAASIDHPGVGGDRPRGEVLPTPVPRAGEHRAMAPAGTPPRRPPDGGNVGRRGHTSVAPCDGPSWSGSFGTLSDGRRGDRPHRRRSHRRHVGWQACHGVLQCPRPAGRITVEAARALRSGRCCRARSAGRRTRRSPAPGAGTAGRVRAQMGQV